jgi:hypothetical protein
MMEAAAVLVMGLVAVAGVWYGLRSRRTQRQVQLRNIAEALALMWVAADDKDLRRRLANFQLFAPVDASRAYAILTGQVRGRAVTVIDYDYGDFINSGFNPYLVLVFETNRILPTFWLHPKGSLNSTRSGSATALASFPGLGSYVLEGVSPGQALLAHCEGVRAQGYWPSVANQGKTLIYYEPLRRQPSFEGIGRILDDGARACQQWVGV